MHYKYKHTKTATIQGTRKAYISPFDTDNQQLKRLVLMNALSPKLGHNHTSATLRDHLGNPQFLDGVHVAHLFMFLKY